MRRFISVFICLMAFVSVVYTQPVTEPPAELNLADGMIPLDPLVRVGSLPNGLTYYIRKNAKPENRAELRLVVNAGSVLEEDDQQGVAHLLEHMAFNGTTGYEKQELVNYLESIGTRFGPDLNAYTGFDETVYMLQVPTDETEKLATGIKILREWAGNITLDEEEIDKERGVVLEEWRLGRGADSRIQDKHFPKIFFGSKYAERLPIGKTEVIETVPADRIRRFYTDWYRPDLMSVIAVGDFEPDSLESLIRSSFSDLQRAESTPERRPVQVPDHDETLVSIASDPEARFGKVGVLYKFPREQRANLMQYRQNLVENLYNAMINVRLSEYAQKADPPFAAAFAGKSGFSRSSDAYQMVALVFQGGVTRALEVLLTEAERVSQFGFTQSELDRQKTDLERAYDQQFAEREKTESGLYAGQYVQHYLSQSPTPGIRFDYAFLKRVLPGITLEEVNRVASEWISEKNRVIIADGPENDQFIIPTQDDLLKTFETVASAEIVAYEDEVLDEPLISVIPEPVAILSETTDETLGTTRIVLANGVTVVMKSTDFKNDELLLSARSSGGTSLVSDEVYHTASQASSIVGQSGVGAFGPIALTKKLAGKVAGVFPSVSSRSEGLSGFASPQDIETLFQLTHLVFTAPRVDDDAFQAYVSNMSGMLRNMKSDPESAFMDTVSVTMAQNHYRAQPLTEDILRSIDKDLALRIFRERFADADDFTFYLVGNLDPVQVKELSARYLGSLPSVEGKEEARDTGLRAPGGVIEKYVRTGVEPKSSTQIFFTGPTTWSPENRARMDMLMGVLNIRLREVLREDLSGTYSVRAGGSISREPVEEYSVRMSYGSDPGRADTLFSALKAVLDELRTKGPSVENMQKVIEEEKTQHEISLKSNSWWLSSLVNTDRQLVQAEDVIRGPVPRLESLTPEEIKEAANTFLDMNRYARFVHLPKETGME